MPERWSRIEALYHDARERDAGARASFLDAACADDESLRREVESLLAQTVSGDGFLSGTALMAAAAIVRERDGRLTGRRIGSYEIQELLGAGGMGEVYRAIDTRLRREVAIKCLPSLFADDHDRLARFDREARILAALNHPHIGAIYGLEESAGLRGLVLELVEGETLADRIRRGPLPIGEALAIARQLADALEAAHDSGIVHRDLKPANIKITRAGIVKVLDFGLAKAIAGDASSPDLSQCGAADDGVLAGAILGTAAYMSPEQARARPVDTRTDIWAFGCVLYEMLTGRVPFSGATVADTIVAVLEGEPDWAALPPATPQAIRRLLRRSLQKDAAVRLRHIADARLEIDEAGVEPVAIERATSQRSWRGARRWWLGGVALTSLIAVLLAAAILRPDRPPPELQFDIETPRVSEPDDLASLAVSPDGQTIAFVAAVDGPPQLWIRQLDSVAARPVAGTSDASLPFWSPDGRSIAFYADGVLKRIDLADGGIRTLTEATAGVGGAWNRDGVILVAQNPATSITRIPADGGQPAPATQLREGHAGHSFPHVLPDGRHFLYYVTGTTEARGVYLGRLDALETRRLFDADSAAVYASGHLLFVRGATLFAVAFDPVERRVNGHPFPVADGVMGNIPTNIRAALSAAGGTLAFRVGSTTGARRFVWVDRSGASRATVGDLEDGFVTSPSMSPDGAFVALLRRVHGNSDVWLLETRRGVLSRFTDHAGEDIFPVWSRDGGQIAFTSNRNGRFDLYRKSTTGGGAEDLLLAGGPDEAFACDWSPDGRFLLYERRSVTTGWNLWALPLRPQGQPFALHETRFDERDAQISPDGRWIAFHSNRSGRSEIYVAPFPGPGGTPLQVSTGGGAQVRWRPDGRELFYIAPDGRLVAASIALPADGRIVAGTPVPLFDSQVGRVGVTGAQYVVAPDGQRFLMNALAPDSRPAPIRVVLNWRPRP